MGLDLRSVSALILTSGFPAPRYAMAALRSQKARRFMLKAMLAIPIFAVARSIPMVRTKRPMRDFISANGCSTADRTFDRAALARS